MSYPDEQIISSDYSLPVAGQTAMNSKFVFATLTVLIGNEFVLSEHIPPGTTAAELWNPWTWFWPYAIAAAEGYRDYFEKAQKATNELYQQVEKTNAFPWIVGKPSTPQDNQGGNGGQNNQGGNGGQNNQGGNTEQNNQGGNTGQNNQGGSTGQNNQGGNGGQNNQGGNTEQNNQGGNTGQNNQGGSTQPNQTGDNAQNNQGGSTQPNQGNNTGNETPGEGAPQEQNSGAGSGSPGLQVQGNTQDDGNANAGFDVNA